MRNVLLTGVAAAALGVSAPAFAGNIVLTGHDNDFHQDGQAKAATTSELSFVRDGSTLPVLVIDDGSEAINFVTGILGASSVVGTTVGAVTAAQLRPQPVQRLRRRLRHVMRRLRQPGRHGHAAGDLLHRDRQLLRRRRRHPRLHRGRRSRRLRLRPGGGGLGPDLLQLRLRRDGERPGRPARRLPVGQRRRDAQHLLRTRHPRNRIGLQGGRKVRDQRPGRDALHRRRHHHRHHDHRRRRNPRARADQPRPARRRPVRPRRGQALPQLERATRPCRSGGSAQAPPPDLACGGRKREHSTG